MQIACNSSELHAISFLLISLTLPPQNSPMLYFSKLQIRGTNKVLLIQQ